MTRSRGELHEIDELARELPRFRPDDARAEQVRTETLARVAQVATTMPERGRRARAAVWFALPVAAAAGLVWFVMSRDDQEAAEPAVATADAPPAPVARLVREIRPRPGARLESSLSDETVRLGDGSIEVEAAGLGERDAVRVATRDAEIEARSATFEVEARDDRLVAVIVREGRVEMRASSERTLRVITAGESWTAPPPDAGLPATGALDRPPERRSPGAKEPKRTTSAAPAPPSASPRPAPGEHEFQAGWAELRAGKARQAAESFAAARRAAGEGGLGEDAHFWQGIALARSGQRARATEVLREFAREHPRSSRAGEASAKLGWLLYDAGRLDEAERYFEAAAADRVPQVQKSARDGLEAIERRRNSP